ncbi:hypothetical protein SC828_09010 [Legionella pneumophila serogroup 1]
MKFTSLCLAVFVLALTGCAKDTLDSPCPNYGRGCNKQPVNSWDYYQGVDK